MKCSLGISKFLEEISSLSHSIVFLYFFALITEEGFLISPCYSLEFCIQMGIYFLFAFAFRFSSFHSYNPLVIRYHHLSIKSSPFDYLHTIVCTYNVRVWKPEVTRPLRLFHNQCFYRSGLSATAQGKYMLFWPDLVLLSLLVSLTFLPRLPSLTSSGWNIHDAVVKN